MNRKTQNTRTYQSGLRLSVSEYLHDTNPVTCDLCGKLHRNYRIISLGDASTAICSVCTGEDKPDPEAQS